MTLDILDFIDNKGGNAEAIRESQRKRGNSVELVDEVIQMYHDWVKSALLISAFRLILKCPSGLRGKCPQKRSQRCSKTDLSEEKSNINPIWVAVALLTSTEQAKEPADELVAQKKQIDAQVEALVKGSKEFEIQMRIKATNVGNIVGKNVPVSLTEAS